MHLLRHMRIIPNVKIEGRERRKISDWSGAAFFFCYAWLSFALGLGIFRRTPAVALFLLPTFLHELIVAISFLIRRPLRAESDGWGARAAAYGGTFLIPVFSFFAGRWEPTWMKPSSPELFAIGAVLWTMGTGLAVFSVYRLRLAFSIVPQARVLVTSGPYRFARHPVYASYVLQYVGFTVAYLTIPTVFVFAGWIALAMLRMSYEERVLAAAFPEYADYRRRVGRFIPRWTHGPVQSPPPIHPMTFSRKSD